MPWWGWCIFGLALLTMELAISGGLFLLFFGFGALITGAFVAVGMPGGALAWACFGVISLLGVVFLRDRIRSKEGNGAPDKDIVGEVGIASELIQPGSAGTIELRGANWRAINIGAKVIPGGGARCFVEQIEGLTLKVRLEE